MAHGFTLRLITRQAGGGEIVRTRSVAGESLSVGRGAGADIVISDLAVDLDHARITHAGAGRVIIEAIGAGGFELNGRKAARAEVDLAGEPVLGFGAFDVALAPGEDGQTAVVVTRREDGHEAGVSVFSLKAAMFGRRRMAWILGLAIVALCLILPVAGALYLNNLKIHPDKQWSSGPLSQAHAFLDDDCQSCHQKAFVAVRDETCLTCHQAGDDPAKAARLDASLKAQGSPTPARVIFEHADHQRLLKGAPGPRTPAGMAKAVFQKALNHPSDRCASCHLEHTGPPVGSPAGARATTPALVMGDCAGCHADLARRLPSTPLRNVANWGDHPTFRPLVTFSVEGAQPLLRRMALSEKPRENSGLIFPHRLHLDQTGGVARQAIELGRARGYGGALACASCHRPDAPGTGFKPIEMERDCGSCHSLAFAGGPSSLRNLPHGDVAEVMAALQAQSGGGVALPARRRPGAFFAPAAPGTGSARGAFDAAFREGGACYDCHTVQRTGDALGVRIAKVHLTDRFLPRGGFDHSVPAHRGQGPGAAACADCHKAKTSDTAQDFMIPDLATCATCHGKTTAQTPAAASADCATCHSFHTPGSPMLTPQDKLLRAIRASWEPPPKR